MSESSPVTPRIRQRIENLSDLVFGLALSIGSILLISKFPQTPTDLVSGILLFAYSFLIVVWIWSGYTSLMVVLPFEIAGTYLLNIALLFCVAIWPYLFYVLQESQFSMLSFASSALALDVGAMMLILAGLTYLFLGEERKHDAHNLPPDRLKRFRQAMIAETVVGAIFIASATPPFWIPVPIGNFLRFDIWWVTLAAFFVVTARVRNRR